MNYDEQQYLARMKERLPLRQYQRLVARAASLRHWAERRKHWLEGLAGVKNAPLDYRGLVVIETYRGRSRVTTTMSMATERKLNLRGMYVLSHKGRRRRGYTRPIPLPHYECGAMKNSLYHEFSNDD